MSELVLGTAQFGTPYGVTNAVGRLTDAGVAEILEVARDGGIQLLDTAADYGDAASRIADLRPAGAAPGYVTKFSLPADGSLPTEASLIGSALATLRVESLHGVMFHRIDDLDDGRLDESWALLRRARDDGPRAAESARASTTTPISPSCATASPVSTCFRSPGTCSTVGSSTRRRSRRPVRRGSRCTSRSAYLQGVLLADPSSLPVHLAGLVPALEELAAVAAGAGITAARLALGFLAGHPAADAVLVRGHDGRRAPRFPRGLERVGTPGAAGVPRPGGGPPRSAALATGRARPMILGVLQARCSSTRFPGKVIAPLHGRPMILRQLERLAASRTLDRVVVATSVDPSDDPLADLLGAEGIEVRRGPLDDVLGRFALVVDEFAPDQVVRLTADCPLADPAVVDLGRRRPSRERPRLHLQCATPDLPGRARRRSHRGPRVRQAQSARPHGARSRARHPGHRRAPRPSSRSATSRSRRTARICAGRSTCPPTSTS